LSSCFEVGMEAVGWSEAKTEASWKLLSNGTALLGYGGEDRRYRTSMVCVFSTGGRRRQNM
jgi:hypothetical protein